MASFVFPREADGIRLTRIIATLRSAESGAAAIAFGINSIGLSLVQVRCAWVFNSARTDLCLDRMDQFGIRNLGHLPRWICPPVYLGRGPKGYF
jgi:hypothetical protein